ncbi:MAG: AAA family ATPase [Crocinitomicaceae bacterium]
MLETSEQSINPAESLRQLSEEIKLELIGIDKLKSEISRVIIGQDKMVDSLIIALLTNGHVLLEGTPGLAKTLAIKTLSESIDASFSRIQFTPDLLPADLTGTMIYKQKSEVFDVKKGPIFASFVLADEINRAPAKVQSALLEAMQERQITIGDQTFSLPDPFLVLATQNPIEQEGTYPLPEAQIDRFMLKINLTYPSPSEEKLIIRQAIQPEGVDKASKVMTTKDISRMRELVRKVYLDEKIEQYIVNIISATRSPERYNQGGMLVYGSSPRGSINLALAAKAFAFLKGRSFVIPEDIRAMAVDVLQHRIGLSYEADAERITSKQIIERLVSVVDVP